MAAVCSRVVETLGRQGAVACQQGEQPLQFVHAFAQQVRRHIARPDARLQLADALLNDALCKGWGSGFVHGWAAKCAQLPW